MKNTAPFGFLKKLLTFLAIVNLILLFGFHYEIPSFIKNKFFAAEETIQKPEEKAPALTITFEPEVLHYDGSKSLNLEEGVTITNEKGENVEASLYSTIKNAEEKGKKLITYTAKDEATGLSTMAERTLILENYEGPALSIKEPYPDIYDVELKYIADTFAEGDLITATDGYEKDIHDAVTCTYLVTNDIATEVKITFSVTNHFNDTVSKTLTLPILRTKPLILLSDTSITLKKGSAFDPMTYVVSAINEEGEDLKGIITTEGEVNLAEAGTYRVSYTLTDSDREQADPVILSVTVKE